MYQRRSCVCLAACIVLGIGASSAGELSEAVGVAARNDSVWVLDVSGRVGKFDAGARVVTAVFASRATRPADLVIDASGNIALADNDPHGSQRITVFDEHGTLLRELTYSQTTLQRLARVPDGTLMALAHDSKLGLHVKRFTRGYSALSSVPVAGDCPANHIRNSLPLATMAADGDGNVWIADVIGCGSTYTFRKYGPGGVLLGRFEGTHNLESAEGLTMVVSEIVAVDGRILIVLGGMKPEKGLEVDIWTVGGDYVKRIMLPGFSDPLVRGAVVDGQVYFAGRHDPSSPHTIPVSTFVN